MFICIVILILLLPLTALPLALKFFPPSELVDMGIDLENPQSHESPPAFPVQSCQLGLSPGLPA